jgi:hypothetical protein
MYCTIHIIKTQQSLILFIISGFVLIFNRITKNRIIEEQMLIVLKGL